MAETLIEAVEFRARAPKVALPGLDDVLAKLRAIDAAFTAINGRLAGLSTNSAFRRTKAEMADLLKGFGQGTRKIVPVKDVAKALGIPDQKDFDAFIANFKARNKGKMRSMFASEHVAGRGGAPQRIAGFASADKAAQMAQSYFKQAFKNAKEPVAAMQALFGSGSSPAKAQNPKPEAGGEISLVVPAAQIVATLGPGTISLLVPASAVGSGASRGGGPPQGGTPTASPGGGAGPTGLAGGNVVEERITTMASGKRQIQRRELVSAGKTLDKFYKDVGGVLEPLKEVEGNNFAKAAKTKLDNQMAAVKQELAAQAALPARRRDPATLAKLYAKQADQMDALVSGRSGRELNKLGLLPEVNRALGSSGAMRAKAAAYEEKAMVQRQGELAADMRRTGQMRKLLDAAKQKGDKAEQARLKSERVELEKRIAANNKFMAAGAKSHAQNNAMQAKVQTFTTKQAQTQAYRQATYSGADYAWQDFLNSGGRMVSSTQKGASGARVLVGERENGGQIERMTVSYGQAGAEVTRLTKAMSEARKEGGYLAGDFIKNTAQMTLWAASVGVLYKSLELVTFSMGRLVAISPQVGRLEQVFKGVGGTAQDLTVDVLGLAAANGADTHAAMEAAIQWSRLGLTRVQVNEAVRLSLIAANVAQIDALEATEKLQGVYQAYGLSLSELRSELGEVVALTNTYNVTTDDLLTGLSRVASVAKQAGLPLAELQGLLASTIGGTAQSGANIGNMMKSVILSLSNPKMQKELRQGFQFETSSGGAEIKGMSQILGDLFEKYQQLNDAQRQSLLFSIAGKTQASRLASLLDNYVKSQTLAVNAQLALNTAEVENEKIKNALRAQLMGLTAEWERFVVVQGNRGPVQALEQLSRGLKGVLALMNTGGGSMLTTGMLGLLTAAGMKVAMTGMQAQGAGGKPGFLGRSGARVIGAASGLNNLVNESAMVFGATGQLNLGFAKISAGPLRNVVASANILGQGMFNVARGMTGAAATTRVFAAAAGVAFKTLSMATAALAEFLIPLVAVAAGIWLFNQGIEAIGLSSERAEKRLAGFNAEAEKFSAAAAAAAEAATLFQTVERALPNMRSDADRKHMLMQAAEATHGDIGDPQQRAKAVAQTRDEWLLLLKQGDARKLNKALEAERTAELKRNLDLLQQEYEARQRSMQVNAAEIARLENRQSGFWGTLGHTSRQKKIDELKGSQAQMETAQVRNTLDQTNEDSLEKRLEYDTETAARLKTQETTLQAIADLYSGLAARNPFEKASLGIAALEAQVGAIDLRLGALKVKDDADFAGKDAREKRMGELKEQEKTLRDKLATANAALKYASEHGGIMDPEYQNPTIRGWVATVQESESGLAANQLDQDQVAAGFLPDTAPDESDRNRLERQRLYEDREKKVAERDAMQANLQIVAMQTQMQFGREEADRETSPSEVGRDETQKLQNKRDAIKKKLAEASPGPQTAAAVSRDLELENKLYETQMDLRKRQYDVEKEINQLIVDRRKEFEHSILGAGPAEMLRKLAAFKMGLGGGMGIGQFLSLTPDMRHDVGMLDTRFDPSMMDLRREQNRQPEQSENDFDQYQMEISNQIAEVAASLSKLIPNTSTYDAAAKSVDALGSMAGMAADQLRALAGTTAEAVAQLAGIRGPGSLTPAGSPPVNPQAGGLGGGRGVMPRGVTAGDEG